LVLEKADRVGGLARTETYKGYRFDIGGHRFFTNLAEVRHLWQQMLGEDFRTVRRLSRIQYRGKLFDYPLDFANTLSGLGFTESLSILASYLRARAVPHPREETFEQWVSNRFGQRLYETFFRTYTEKVWGIPCSQIRADWAAQRIQGLSFMTAISNALFNTNHTRSLINQFHYPVLGPGMMWQRFHEAVRARGGQVWLEAEVVGLEREGGRVVSIEVRRRNTRQTMRGDSVISTIPLPQLIRRLNPPPPDDVLEAGNVLSYRAFVLVGLIVAREMVFPDNWLYIHSPEVKVGRIQNFKNWSAAMVPDPQKTSLGMEYFCSEGDDFWQQSDERLIALATRELAKLRLAGANEVEDGVIIRQPAAYPVYDNAYRPNVAVLRRFLERVDNLQTVGRGGMHRYNNQDHSMLTGLLAVRNLLGGGFDLWDVTDDQRYLEGGG